MCEEAGWFDLDGLLCLNPSARRQTLAAPAATIEFSVPDDANPPAGAWIPRTSPLCAAGSFDPLPHHRGGRVESTAIALMYLLSDGFTYATEASEQAAQE